MPPLTVGESHAEGNAEAADRTRSRHAPAAAEQQHHVPHRWWVLAVIGLAQLMVVLDVTIMNIALPTAQQHLHFDNNGRQWIVTAYSLAFGSLLLLGGRLADLFGRRVTFLVGLVGFAGASALGGAAQDFKMLVIARAVQGAFGAVLAPSALSLLTTTFTDPKERAKAFGVFGAIAGSGGAVGLLVGGLLTEHLSWRWTLYVNCFIAVFAVVGALAFVRQQPQTHKPKLDVLGTLLAAGGLFCVVYGFANAQTYSWGDRMCWGFLAGGGVLLLAFVLWEMRAAHPLLPLRVFADRNRGASFLSVFVLGAGMFGIMLFLTYYLQSTLHYSPVRTGLAFLPLIGAMMVFAQLGMLVLVPRVGGKPVAPVGMALAVGGMIWLTKLDLNSSYPAHVLPGLLLVGCGLGLVMPCALSLATYGVAANDQGVASASINTMQQVGGSIGVALFSTMAAKSATHYVDHHLTMPKPLLAAEAALHSYATGYWWAAGFFAVGALLALLLYRAGRPMAAPTPAGAPAAPSAALDAAPADSRRAIEAGHVGPAVHGRVLTPGGGTLQGAAITLIDQTGHQLGRALSGPDGSFELSAPTAGTYLLVGSARGLQPQVSAVALGSGPTATDVVLGGAGGLSGTVRANGAPVQGAVVVVSDARGEVIGSAVTDASGEYLLTDIPAGACTVTVSASGHRPTAGPVEVDGASPTRHDVDLREAVQLRGTVRDSHGLPVTDAKVALLDRSGTVITSLTTGPDGTYAFVDLTGGDYTLIASGYPPQATSVSITDAERTAVDMTLGHEEE
ncbi:MFS transporter [Streptomyces sp. RB6PN25]|uniref:MFS transporter n=1 Tax=Streptomyces humicola TaxID=2953240 RepID=A0ABT1Q3J8_9ACTN|nr:MFS transporter [Streptomyces humicola]MCQ4084493.1 MFS transporter [Streptomyces humicola]